MNKILPYQRRVQVFEILKEHGPLSIRGIEACLQTPIRRKKLQEVLNRLHRRGLLRKRFDKALGGGGVSYQIAQDPTTRAIVGELLDVVPEALHQPQYRHRTFIHSENCAVWFEILSRMFPDFRIVKEHEIGDDPIASRLLLLKDEEDDVCPDLLLIAPSKAGSGHVSIAVEIEKTGKTKKRLLRKLKKYATQTLLDGMVYVCDTHSICERLRQVYQSKVIERALRIKHYENNFFLFSDGSLSSSRLEPAMFNSRLEDISLSDWIRTLTNTNYKHRRDEKFNVRGSDPRASREENILGVEEKKL